MYLMAMSPYFGGDKRDRTADLLNAIQALSQLSYTPIFNYPQHSINLFAELQTVFQIIKNFSQMFCFSKTFNFRLRFGAAHWMMCSPS